MGISIFALNTVHSTRLKFCQHFSLKGNKRPKYIPLLCGAVWCSIFSWCTVGLFNSVPAVQTIQPKPQCDANTVLHFHRTSKKLKSLIVRLGTVTRYSGLFQPSILRLNFFFEMHTHTHQRWGLTMTPPQCKLHIFHANLTWFNLFKLRACVHIISLKCWGIWLKTPTRTV